ncbi:alkaline phosphatase family protein [Demequina sp.]|uniref:phage holin family protein n=1 Tax=Demequina sp. TaxID=2050685 RepID=UPI003A8AA365
MSASRHEAAGARRPPSVLALIGLTLLTGAASLALGFVLAIEGSGLSSRAPWSANAVVVSALFVTVGAAHVALGVLLVRGANTARVILTVLAALTVLATWYDALGAGSDALRVGLGPVAIEATLVALAWVRPTRRYFQSEQGRRIGRAVQTTTRSGWRRAAEVLAQVAMLGLTVWITPGVGADHWFAVPLAAVAVGVVSWALQPLLLHVAGRFGWVGALSTALLAQVTTLGLALWVTPGIVVSSLWWAVVATWVFAIGSTLVAWGFSVGTEDYLLVHAARMAASAPALEDAQVRGVVFVQLDGVPAPLLESQLRAGNLPTISRWIRSGSHTWTEWTARVPSTTPVSQAGILHGSNENIPAFRWWDRSLGRLLVANRPADATLIEAMVSDGRGLLADDGVSISNLFTGDAPTSHLTMSAAGSANAALGGTEAYATFFAHPAGFSRALVLTLGEMVKERVQAWRQERRDVQPRVHRGGAYVLLRGVTNVMLRDLNVSLVVGSMARGARSIYVDFVDYDEIAHHAGVTRPESLASLYGLDGVLSTLERFAESGLAARPYDIVLVSDHGQSQGATFLQRAGVSLEELVRSSTGATSVAVAVDREGAGAPAELLVSELAGTGSRTARAAQRAIAGADARAESRDSPPRGVAGTPEIAVVGSGNLGGIWFTDADHGLDLTEIDERHPELVATLAGHLGIGFVVVRTADGPVAIGERGTRDLHTSVVTGEDPLAPYPAHTAADFARASAFLDAPDIYVNSVYDAQLDEVAAFEELVGCHGGVGGWQTRPLLVYPAAWHMGRDLVDSSGRLYGADAVHRQLVRWLEELGHRSALAGPPGEPG